MKVLMFGWEYPPHVYGGLATANYVFQKVCMHRVMWTLRSVCHIPLVMKTRRQRGLLP